MMLAPRLPLAALLACVTTAALAQGVDLPLGFDGRYAPEGVACEGLMVITVEDGIMAGGDFGIIVTDLVEDPVNPRRVEASLLSQGGGEEWADSAVLTLAEDGQSLRFDYADGTGITWLRCP